MSKKMEKILRQCEPRTVVYCASFTNYAGVVCWNPKTKMHGYIIFNRNLKELERGRESKSYGHVARVLHQKMKAKVEVG